MISPAGMLSSVMAYMGPMLGEALRSAHTMALPSRACLLTA